LIDINNIVQNNYNINRRDRFLDNVKQTYNIVFRRSMIWNIKY